LQPDNDAGFYFGASAVECEERMVQKSGSRAHFFLQIQAALAGALSLTAGALSGVFNLRSCKIEITRVQSLMQAHRGLLRSLSWYAAHFPFRDKSFYLPTRHAMVHTDDRSRPVPSQATDAVLLPSDPVPEGMQRVEGIDFNAHRAADITVAELVDGMANMGFQASAVADAAQIINQMVRQESISRLYIQPNLIWST
jgi:hypothetical protein